MKTKTINSVISKKIKDWANSIEDDEVKSLVLKNTIVTGGCIASMLLKEPVNDYDVYFRNRETALAVAKYYLDRFDPKNANVIKRQIYIDEGYSDRVKIVVKSSGIASENENNAEYRYFERNEQETPDAGQYVTELMSDSGDIEDTYDDLNEKAQEVNTGDYRPVFVSTNAILVFDIDLGEEMPEFLEEFDGDFDAYLESISGLPKYGEDGHSFEDQLEFRDKYPLDMTLHCSCDYPMYILSVRGTEICASRGYQELINPFKLEYPNMKQYEFMREFCDKNGIEWENPAWYLASMWC